MREVRIQTNKYLCWKRKAKRKDRERIKKNKRNQKATIKGGKTQRERYKTFLTKEKPVDSEKLSLGNAALLIAHYNNQSALGEGVWVIGGELEKEILGMGSV